MAIKIITTLEISSNAVKTITGYVLDNQPIILHSDLEPLPEGTLKNSMITDYDAVTKAAKKVIYGTENRLKREIKEVVLVIPSIGFEVYQHNQTTSVVANTNEIARLDISNVRSQVTKAKINDALTIVDVVADKYVYDNGESIEPPLGKISTSLQLYAKLHAAPLVIVNGYKRIVSQLGLKISKIVVSCYAGAEFIKNLQKLPKSYILLDLGAQNIVASLVGENQVYNSTYAPYGVDTLAQGLAQKLDIPFEAAQHLKEKYGIDSRKTTYKTTILTINRGTQKIDIDNVTYNEAMIDLAQKYVYEIKKVVSEIQEIEDYFKKLPLILVGGGTKLYGLMDLIKNIVAPTGAYIVNPFAIGARDARYTNCVGALIVEGNSPLLNDDSLDDDITEYEASNRKIKLHREGEDIPNNNWEEN